jgi:hypothetical protein
MAKDVFKKINEDQKARQRRNAINQMNRRGTNLFFNAIESGKIDDVYRLVQEGAQLDARTTAGGVLAVMGANVPYAVGATPLHAACLLGSPAIVSFLLEKGADVQARDNEGQTPLDYAILSHSYYEQEFNRKLSSRLTFQSSVDKAQGRVEDVENVILKLLKRGAKPGMFALPDKFKDQTPPSPGFDPPSL